MLTGYNMNNNLDSLTYYAATKKYDLRFPTLTEDLDVDVVIIGGGFSGVNTALELAEKGITNIAILEGRTLGYGGTGRNGGQVMAGIGHDLDRIKRHVGEKGLETIFKISNMGAGIIRDRIAKYDIKADFCKGYGYLGYNARQEKTLRGWLKEFQAACPDEEIELYVGADVKKVIGSDLYTCALKHMGGGHVHSLNLLLGEAKAATEQGVRIFENSQVVNVEYGPRVTVRTAMGTVRASKILWACNAFLNGLEPTIYKKTINTYAFQLMTEELSDDLIEKISPIRGAYSDISPVINYYRVTKENRVLFGSATQYLEYIPSDLKAWNRKRMLDVFPYLKDVKIELAWGGPLSCSVNLFPQIGSLPEHDNVFYVQGYSGFGVTPSHIVCKILAEGMSEGSERYSLMSSIPHLNVVGKDKLRSLLLSVGKTWHQASGYWKGRR
ncbi:putative oxidoreductase with FAD/NAD(P)-binding domain [Xenorhabdus bovienii str. feltiae Florida]|uniref:Putative oxidoreductase with FAD/NAD(P)-binding domain n=3 Tax=Xenorhabdus bovienii TaxID=40576 RepID=A0A0B6X853_XENBV|nr:putative oxidoreductase with FAD/NAD(P)-binding domain [Xenorhabdus bovienii str. feltiae France]CDG92944.1 putative oxidoreductase with FAD/NAD(P)-binding domain [Xenorhabdus bovienii str. feltiae Florida]CDH01545.1 putative oxidoreductase with FAD/NAD(P)-binding domain [Xenorhabdus bovienii str. feltiae Moldova]CDM88494.1 putative oxidoreductase with FAD/NAD(P)-binding domain [Xenorhabdus bovienii]